MIIFQEHWKDLIEESTFLQELNDSSLT